MPTKKVSLSNVSGDKPSLASLKITKSTNTAARKRAVKKIEAGISKKVGTIKITKKSGEKKVLIKRATQKPKAVPTAESDSVLSLPSNISIRAREKALVILQAVSKDFDKSAQQVAYISGLCFILLGASMSLAFTTPFSKDVSQGAVTVSSTVDTLTTGTAPIAPILTVATPVHTLIDPIPNSVTGATRHKLDVQHALSINVEAISQTGKKVGLKVDTLTNSKFEFLLDAKDLDPGSYYVKLIITGLDQAKHYRALGQFTVPQPPTDVSHDDSGAGGTSGDETTDAQDGDVTETAEEREETHVGTTEVETATTTTEVTDEVPQITLWTPSRTLSGRLALVVRGPDTIEPPRLFVRALSTISQQPRGEAELRDGKWYFFLNTENLPNGEYELMARSSYKGESIKTPAIRVRVENFVKVPTSTVSPTTTVAPTTGTEPAPAPTSVPVPPTTRLTPPITTTAPTPTQPAQGTQNIEQTTLRTFSEFSIEDAEASSTKPTPSDVTGEVDALFTTHQSDLKDLFKRYSIAQQSGDTIMLELAKKELESGKQRIIKDVLNNGNINHLADNIDDELGARFETIQKRVETFEELRRTATNNESASDKDGDGISDYDEEFLFGTDPELADTDNDGVIDGVEVMKGFNPVDPSTEAAIEYEMPQESLGLVEEELLQVQNVAPVVRGDLDEQAPPIQAEIRGKGLPNSFVTLYIFSTPTVVTVRTDQDGSFVYTFEKELEDGEHEVYVAVTDNTGAIVARSNPFRFVKEAQAFTPVNNDGAAIETAAAAPATQSLSMYNIIVGLGILALGLILLMLGVGMREREKMINPVPFDAPKTT